MTPALYALATVVDSLTASSHAAAGHAGMTHSVGPLSVAAAVFPYLAVGALYLRRAVLRRRYRLEALREDAAAAAPAATRG